MRQTADRSNRFHVLLISLLLFIVPLFYTYFRSNNCTCAYFQHLAAQPLPRLNAIPCPAINTYRHFMGPNIIRIHLKWSMKQTNRGNSVPLDFRSHQLVRVLCFVLYFLYTQFSSSVDFQLHKPDTYNYILNVYKQYAPEPSVIVLFLFLARALSLFCSVPCHIFNIPRSLACGACHR